MSSPPRRKMKLSPLTPIKADVVEITPEEIEDGPTTRLVKTEVQSSKTSDRNIKNSVEDKDEEGAYEIEYVEEENSDDEIDAAELRYYSYPSAQITTNTAMIILTKITKSRWSWSLIVLVLIPYGIARNSNINRERINHRTSFR